MPETAELRGRQPGRGIGRVLLALALGTAGGTVFFVLHLPLAWMIGSLAACLAGCMAGLPLHMPRLARPLTLSLIGVLLGANFSPALLEHLAEWAVSLSFLAMFILVGAGLSYLFLRHVAGLAVPTAFFGSFPGGLAEMATFGETVGGDPRRIVLLHSFRILIVVMILPALLWLVVGIWPAPLMTAGASTVWLPGLASSVWMVATAAAGWLLARVARLHAPMLIGPLILSAAIHLTGLSSFHPPLLFIVLAQLVMGTALGSGFAGMARRDFTSSIVLAAATTTILLSVCVGFALALHWVTGLPLVDLLLAYAPGGLSETSLVALSIGATVSFIAVHHVSRVFIITLLAPLIYRRIARHLDR